LNQIRCEETGAEGGNGIVHHAEYKGLQVVTKVSRHSCGNVILKEARILRDLAKHKNIVEYVGLCEDAEAGPVLLLAREPWTLFEVLHSYQARLDAGVASKIGAGIAAGVEYLHAEGIAHLDLKSSNVLLSRDLVPRICDFGHAANRSEGDARPHNAIGTPITAAPEVLLEVSVGLPADAWSTGVILAEMLMKEMPFYGLSFAQVVVSVVHCTEPFSLDFEAPPAYRELVQKCLRRNPADRPSAKEIKEALENISPQEPLSVDEVFPFLLSPADAACAVISRLSRPVRDIAPNCFSWVPPGLRKWMPMWIFV
jgi:serine/threonine protein kinase